jgi:uncharacterized phage protein (TIGR02220 family)
MEKPTKRKAFNFLRSYFDVVNELQNDTDKLNFLMAVINKQFLDEDPNELSFIVKLCYASQKHAIEASVKGWKRVSNTDLKGTPTTNPVTNPTTNPVTNPTTNPKEVEVKEKVKDINLSVNWVGLLEQFNSITNKKIKVIDDKTKRQVIARLKDGYTKADLVLAITNCYNDDYHKENPKYLTLEFISRPDKMQKYCQELKNTKPTKKIEKL